MVIFNWRDEPSDARVAAADVASESVRELVTDTAPRREGAQWVVTVPPRSMRVLAAQP